jgi:hypothetical protein
MVIPVWSNIESGSQNIGTLMKEYYFKFNQRNKTSHQLIEITIRGHSRDGSFDGALEVFTKKRIFSSSIL